MYLECQRRLWPTSSNGGEFSLAAKSAQQLADEFKRAFLDPDWRPLGNIQCPRFAAAIGLAYLRYSCDNSNPRSLPQQLRNCLEKAGSMKVFIPWFMVFADAAVTGTIAQRRGYQMAKSVVEHTTGAAVLFIDELGRAARDTVECVKLGRLVAARQKRLMGASDGIDSNNQQSQLLLGIYATLQEDFVTQLRKKVGRGMLDAFERGDNIRPPGFAYKLVPRTDESKNMVLDRKGRPDMIKVIDQSLAKYVILAFRLFVRKLWSPARIARLFNSRGIGGRTTWDATYLRKRILTNRNYIGEECEGMTCAVTDPDTGQKKFVAVPEDKWLRRNSPHLRIISDAQVRMKECSDAYSSQRKSGPGRASAYPKTLFRPICGVCGYELSLGRSGTKSSLCCLNGVLQKNNCTFRGYKSVRIVETCILTHIRQVLFNDERIPQLVKRVNAFLAAEAKRPMKDLEPLRKRVRSIRGILERLTNQLELSGSETVAKRIAERELELQSAEQQLKKANRTDVTSLTPITITDVTPLLNDLRGLLEGSKEQTAVVLRKLTGPIIVEKETRAGKEKATWMARFEMNEVPVLLELAQSSKSPTAGTWEYLQTYGWTFPINAKVDLEIVPRHVTLAPIVKQMRDEGASINAIAIAHGLDWPFVNAVLKFAETGVFPSYRVSKGKPRKGRTLLGNEPSSHQVPKYVVHSDLVARLHDEERKTFSEIERHLNVELGIEIAYPTILRAYDHARPDLARQCAENGGRMNRGRRSRLGEAKYLRIRELIQTRPDCTNQQIADEVGCGASSVHRERQRMQKKKCEPA